MPAASKPSLPILLGDIGGTNTRFQILQNLLEPPLQFESVRTADFKNLETAIEKVVLENTSLVPKTAIIAAAGSVGNLGLKLTNSLWDLRPQEILKNSPFQELILMNDFEAQALSLPFLKATDLYNLGGISTPHNNNQTKAVIGPGTGLGEGVLVHAENKWIPLTGEGGHADLGPRTKREFQLWQYLERIEGRISAEQVLSGAGLLNLYQASCALAKSKPEFNKPEAVSQAALANSDAHAVEALNLFCTCLGRVAGDLALTSMAKGGVYIAGGIAKNILTFFDQSGFRSDFEDKAPHSQLMQTIPTYIVTHELPALVGLAAYARNPSAFTIDIEQRRWKLPPQ